MNIVLFSEMIDHHIELATYNVVMQHIIGLICGNNIIGKRSLFQPSNWLLLSLLIESGTQPVISNLHLTRKEDDAHKADHLLPIKIR